MENKPQQLKGGYQKMENKMKTNKLMGMFMVGLMAISIFASAGIVIAQNDNSGETGGDSYNGVTRGFANAKITAERRSLGVANSVDAVKVFPEDSGVLDAISVNEAIDNFDDSLDKNERKVGFFRGTFGKGHFIDNENDHLGFIQGLWVSNSVTDSSEVSEAVVRSAGKVRVDGKVYRLTQKTFEDDNIVFNMLSVDERIKGTLSLELVDSYDDGVRKIWNGKIELGDISGEVDLVTVTKSVRKASENELERGRPGTNDDVGTNMPNSEGETNAGEGPGNPVESENRNVFRRVFDYFRAEKA